MAHKADEQVNDDDLYLIIDDIISRKSLVHHHLKSFNTFVSIGISQIVTQLFTIEKSIVNERNSTPEDRDIAMINFKINFTAVRMARPITASYVTGELGPLMPNEAREFNRNYSAPFSIDAKIEVKAYPRSGSEPRVRTAEVLNFQIASVPIMVQSNLCHTSSLSEEGRRQIREDPQDPGGYFILKGKEWVISVIESRPFNHPNIFRNIGYRQEIARLEFISKPGDAYENSSEIIIRYLTSKHIYIKLTSHEYFKHLDIPFYIIFRLFGMETDKEIVDNIIYGPANDVISEHMLSVLKGAFTAQDPQFVQMQNVVSPAQLLRLFCQRINMATQKKEADANTLRYLTANIPKFLDRYMLPHLGTGPDSRHKKMRYLGHLIHELLLVEMQIVPSTDRDALKNKRMNAAGRAYAKSFKTQFNLTVVQSVKKKFTQEFKRMPFSQVPLEQTFRNSIRGGDLEKALIQSIVTGNKEITVRNRHIPNRLASEMLHRKNQLNFLASLRVIRAPTSSANTQDERSDEMRRVHPSYFGSICPIQSADTGEQVGIVKQLAQSGFIIEASTAQLVTDALLADPDVIPLERVFAHQIRELDLAKIMVNGDWIGCCTNSFKVWHRFREYRRGYELVGAKFKHTGKPKIHRKTTIYWDTHTDKLVFWVDAGRIVHPLFVVRNNSELDPIGQEYFNSKFDSTDPKSQFVQDILYTKADARAMLAGRLTAKDLLHRGIIDYIAPDELENCLVATSVEELRRERHNPLRQFTHCEIPVGLIGLPAVTCPHAHHNQLPRITFQSNQVKQTCGVYALNWPFRIDKHTFLQWETQMPIIKTAVSKWIYPNGMNLIVAIAYCGGYNQEDSLIFNRAAVQSGLCKGSHFNFVKTELEKGEKLGIPNEANTSDINRYANYEHLRANVSIQTGEGNITVSGVCPPKTLIQKNDVVIGKLLELPRGSEKNYKDQSVVYKSIEPAVVDRVLTGRDQDGNEFCKVKLSSTREISIGDKFCLTPDHEVCTLRGWVPISQVNTDDRVLVFNKGLRWEQVRETFAYDVAEDLYVLNTNDARIRATLNHKMFAARRRLCTPKGIAYPAEFIEARDLLHEEAHFFRAFPCEPEGEVPQIPDEHRNNIVMDSKVSAMSILAMFTLYGEIKRNRARIPGVKYLTPEAARWATDFCRAGTSRLFQHPAAIPEFIKSMGRYVVTRKPVDEIQMLCQFAGIGCDIMRLPQFNILYFRDRIFCVTPEDARLEYYEGTVYGFDVPGHNYLVRNVGSCQRAIWTGNSSRHGQKGVVSMIYDHADLPFTESGIVPDLVLSPHAIPSRMTVGQLIEGITAKVGAIKGTHYDATVFRTVDIKAAGRILEEYGFQATGVERMFDGRTGEWIDTMIFITPVYYQRLQKFSIDDVYAVSTGPTAVLTRQYLEGKGNHGGLRIGEMESNVLIAHGTSHFMMEKYRDDSDGFDIYVCRNCKKYPVVNEEKNIIICNTCQNAGMDPDVVKVRSTWCSKLFIQELESCQVGVKLTVAPFEYEAE